MVSWTYSLATADVLPITEIGDRQGRPRVDKFFAVNPDEEH